MMTHRLGRAMLALTLAYTVGWDREAGADIAYVSTLDGYGRPYAFESVDTSTGAVTIISTDTPSLVGLQWVGGQLYGEGYNSGELYRIDPTTGATTDLGKIAPYGAGSGAYVAGPGGLTYLFDGGNNVYTLTPPSTSVTLTTLTNFAYGEVWYAVGPDGLIYGLTRGISQPIEILDPTTGVVTNGPALSQVLSEYGRPFFDGSTLDFVNSNGLYTIDTKSGLVTEAFAFPSNIGGVFAAVGPPPASPAPEPASLALLGAGGIGVHGFLRRRKPARSKAAGARSC